VRPEWREVPAGTLLWRIYVRGGAHPGGWHQFRRYGPVGSARFDHHLPPPHDQDRGILYVALDIPTCLAEAFQATRTIDRARHAPWLVGFRTTAPLQLLDLHSPWPTRAGASMGIASGRRDRARRWSQAIYAAYPASQGLWYPSSMYAGPPCMALYERAADALPLRPSLHLALADPRLDVPLLHLAAEIGYRLVGSPT
jgi:RES domain